MHFYKILFRKTCHHYLELALLQEEDQFVFFILKDN